MSFRLRHLLCVALVAATVLTLPAQSLEHNQAVVQTNKPSAGLTKNPADLDKGRKLFQTHCAMCHGPGGEGAKGPTLAQPSLPRASDDDTLIRIISNGISGTEMPQAHLEPQEITLVAAFVRSLGSLPREPVPGNPEHGAQLYAKAGCTQCHAIRGEGKVFGPDLTDVGLRRSPAYLRRALLDPSADVPQSYSAFRSDIALPENFLYVRLVPHGGEEIDGVRVNEDTFSIQIRDATGRIHSFFKSDLAELHKDFGKSPMPAYGKLFTKDDLDDVVAYLVSLRAQK